MKNLLKNLSIFLVTGVIVLMTFNFILMPLYINARNVVVIPDLEGLTLDEANQLSKSEGIEVVIADTIFTNDLNPNIVIEQFPTSGKEVKLGRSIKVKITQFNQKIIDLCLRIFYDSVPAAFVHQSYQARGEARGGNNQTTRGCSTKSSNPSWLVLCHPVHRYLRSCRSSSS